MVISSRSIAQYVLLCCAVTAVAVTRQHWSALVAVAVVVLSVGIDFALKRRIYDASWETIVPLLIVLLMLAWFAP